jgi:hypothetical protein
MCKGWHVMLRLSMWLRVPHLDDGAGRQDGARVARVVREGRAEVVEGAVVVVRPARRVTVCIVTVAPGRSGQRATASTAAYAPPSRLQPITTAPWGRMRAGAPSVLRGDADLCSAPRPAAPQEEQAQRGEDLGVLWRVLQCLHVHADGLRAGAALVGKRLQIERSSGGSSTPLRWLCRLDGCSNCSPASGEGLAPLPACCAPAHSHPSGSTPCPAGEGTGGEQALVRTFHL